MTTSYMQHLPKAMAVCLLMPWYVCLGTAPTWHLTVKTKKKDIVITVDATPSTTVRELKKRIQPQINKPLAKLRLVCAGRLLQDDETLSMYPRIKDQSTLIVLFQYITHVQLPDGKTIDIRTRPANTIQDIKEKIEANANIPVATQKLLWKGQDCDDDNTLQDYHIQDEATLQLRLTTDDPGSNDASQNPILPPHHAQYIGMILMALSIGMMTYILYHDAQKTSQALPPRKPQPVAPTTRRTRKT